MPLSKRRKRKNGKKVGSGQRIIVDPNKESRVTLQNLIDIVAYQSYVEDGTIDPEAVREELKAKEPVAAEIWAKVQVKRSDDIEIAPGVILRADAVVSMADEVPVYMENSRGEKIGVGTATPIKGDPGHVSIYIEDPNVLAMVSAPVSGLSIGFRRGDQR